MSLAKAARRTASRDEGAAALVLLGSAVMLLSLALPWVELRPNRLAPPAPLNVGTAGWVFGGLALLLALSARRPAWSASLAGLAALLGVLALGRETGAALVGQSPIARASAGAGVWAWLLGGGVALWGATFALRRQSPRLATLLAWGWLPLAPLFALLGGLASWSVWREGVTEGPRLAQELGQHVRLTLTALLVALGVGGPLAVWAAGRERAGNAVLGAANAVQTLPSLALLGLLIAPLAWLANRFPTLREFGVGGIGAAPALVALTLYALLPIVRNGVVALRGVDAAILDAARGMGMTGAQAFWRVALPLALPVWLAGARQATVLLIGVTSVAALIGAGGLGVFIFQGLQSAATDLILLGAIPASLLALLSDGGWRALEHWLTRRAGA